MFIKKIEKQIRKAEIKKEIRMNETIVKYLARQYVDCKYSAIPEEHAKIDDISEAIAALNLKNKLKKLEYDLV